MAGKPFRRWLLAAAAVVLTLAAAAVANAASTPSPRGVYTSVSLLVVAKGGLFSAGPGIELNVNDTATSVFIEAWCAPHATPYDYPLWFWVARRAPLHGHTSFTVDSRELVQKPYNPDQTNGLVPPPVRERVHITGRFTGGVFAGTVRIGGAPCLRTGYRAPLIGHGSPMPF